MGRIGVKVWIFKKELFKKTREDLVEEAKLVPKEVLEELAQDSRNDAACGRRSSRAGHRR